MKKNEYLKLMKDVTILATKARLQKDQIKGIVDDSTRHFAIANEKLAGIKVALENIPKSTIPLDAADIVVIGAEQKRILYAIEKDLRTNVEHLAMQQRHQIELLRETLQKTLTQIEPNSTTCEFDLTPVQEQTRQTQLFLDAGDHELQVIMQKLADNQASIDKYVQSSNVLMFEQELQEAMHKTTQLASRISDIEHCIEDSPALLEKHAEQFTPLLQAFENLMTKTKLLSPQRNIAAPATNHNETLPTLPMATNIEVLPTISVSTSRAAV